MSVSRVIPSIPSPDKTAPSSIEALRLRYGQSGPDTANVWSEVLSGLLAHRSVCAYRPDKLPRGTLEAIIAAAQSAPSSSNLQTRSVVVIEDEARKARLSEFAGDQKYIRQAPVFLVWLARPGARRTAGATGRTPG